MMTEPEVSVPAVMRNYHEVLRNDLATHIPACEPARAFRLLEKYDVLMEQGEDVYRYVEREKLTLVDIS